VVAVGRGVVCGTRLVLLLVADDAVVFNVDDAIVARLKLVVAKVEVLFMLVTLDVIVGAKLDAIVEAVPFPRLMSIDMVALATTLPTALTATSTTDVTLPSISETADCKIGRAPPVTVAVAVAVVCTASVVVLVMAMSLVL
jgi:hypothetical protein